MLIAAPVLESPWPGNFFVRLPYWPQEGPAERGMMGSGACRSSTKAERQSQKLNLFGNCPLVEILFLAFDSVEIPSYSQAQPLLLAIMHHHPDSELMRKAIDLSAEAGIRQRTGGVFGAVIVNKETGEIVGEGFNREWGGGCLGALAGLDAVDPRQPLPEPVGADQEPMYHIHADDHAQACWRTPTPLRECSRWALGRGFGPSPAQAVRAVGKGFCRHVLGQSGPVPTGCAGHPPPPCHHHPPPSSTPSLCWQARRGRCHSQCMQEPGHPCAQGPRALHVGRALPHVLLQQPVGPH